MSSTIINHLPNIENYSYIEPGVESGINLQSIHCNNKTSVTDCHIFVTIICYYYIK